MLTQPHGNSSSIRGKTIHLHSQYVLNDLDDDPIRCQGVQSYAIAAALRVAVLRIMGYESESSLVNAANRALEYADELERTEQLVNQRIEGWFSSLSQGFNNIRLQYYWRRFTFRRPGQQPQVYMFVNNPDPPIEFHPGWIVEGLSWFRPGDVAGHHAFRDEIASRRRAMIDAEQRDFEEANLREVNATIRQLREFANSLD